MQTVYYRHLKQIKCLQETQAVTRNEYGVPDGQNVKVGGAEAVIKLKSIYLYEVAAPHIFS